MKPGIQSACRLSRAELQQEFVVIDLETTGGRPSESRITEIGAVKVRAGKIESEWSSLVNPGQGIPPFVARLTGITDKMVRKAPAFDEAIQPLREFLGDAILVAHRARMDYEVLQAESRRIGLSFEVPVICTFAEAKRFFPGLGNYGLAAVCESFKIPLESHHRALCDARATAILFLHIWKKVYEDEHEHSEPR